MIEKNADPKERLTAAQDIRANLLQSSRTLAATAEDSEIIARMSEVLLKTLRQGGRILTCGNGGSACDAQNFADELVGRFERNRPPLSAIALTVNSSDLTAISNDFGFETVFERQLEAHGRSGDTLVAISTSGNSENVLRAAKKAHELGLNVLGFSGKTGGKLKTLCGICLCVPSDKTSHVQDTHIAVIQTLCGVIEDALFPHAPKAH
ncbi:MAG: SIS domain-containing protein [Elusimicrobiota bacterium]|jgi:D-sedoheptulose 7-phosphate isomerase